MKPGVGIVGPAAGQTGTIAVPGIRLAVRSIGLGCIVKGPEGNVGCTVTGSKGRPDLYGPEGLLSLSTGGPCGNPHGPGGGSG